MSLNDDWFVELERCKKFLLPVFALKRRSAADGPSKSFCISLQKNGFLKGPSNFALALSKYFYKNISGGLKQNLSNFHFNRGDGDGPINL